MTIVKKTWISKQSIVDMCSISKEYVMEKYDAAYKIIKTALTMGHSKYIEIEL